MHIMTTQRANDLLSELGSIACGLGEAASHGEPLESERLADTAVWVQKVRNELDAHIRELIQEHKHQMNDLNGSLEDALSQCADLSHDNKMLSKSLENIRIRDEKLDHFVHNDSGFDAVIGCVNSAQQAFDVMQACLNLAKDTTELLKERDQTERRARALLRFEDEPSVEIPSSLDRLYESVTQEEIE